MPPNEYARVISERVFLLSSRKEIREVLSIELLSLSKIFLLTGSLIDSLINNAKNITIIGGESGEVDHFFGKEMFDPEIIINPVFLSEKFKI